MQNQASYIGANSSLQVLSQTPGEYPPPLVLGKRVRCHGLGVENAQVEPDETQLVQTHAAVLVPQRPQGLTPAQVHSRLKQVSKAAKLKIRNRVSQLMRGKLRHHVQQAARYSTMMQELDGEAPRLLAEDAPDIGDEEGDGFCEDVSQQLFDQLQNHATDGSVCDDKTQVVAMLRRVLRLAETMPSSRPADDTPEDSIETTAARLCGFLERTVDRLPTSQRKAFYKSVLVKLAAHLRRKTREAMVILKVVMYALGEQDKDADPASSALRVDLVLQGLLERLQSELGMAEVPALSGQPDVRDLNVDQLHEAIPELSQLATLVMTFLEEAGEASSASGEPQDEDVAGLPDTGEALGRDSGRP